MSYGHLRLKAAFPCIPVIYPTDFVRTDFSRTDEMPYRKKCFMIRIFIRFLCFFKCGKQNLTCRKQNEVSIFVHVVCDLRNIALCRRNLQLRLLKAMVEENDVLNELYGVIIMRKIQLSKRKQRFWIHLDNIIKSGNGLEYSIILWKNYSWTRVSTWRILGWAWSPNHFLRSSSLSFSSRRSRVSVSKLFSNQSLKWIIASLLREYNDLLYLYIL